MSTRTPYDVAVVGAGAAGLQAALTLGRMRRRVVVLGTDRYRNDPAEEMHNFLGHDGRPPAELRAAARADVERYDTVELLERAVTGVEGAAGAFTLSLEGGGEVVAGRVVLTTGVVDELPDVPGLVELWGDVVAHCPYCHGYEFADKPVGILGSLPYVAHLAGVVDRIAGRVTVLTDGGEPDEDTLSALKRLGADVRRERVLGVRRAPLGLAVDLSGGGSEELGGLFVKTQWGQATPFAEQLGIELSPVGAVPVDAFGRTAVAGVYAAGDLAQPPGLPMPMSSVLTAAAGGLLAASACHQDLVGLELGVA